MPTSRRLAAFSGLLAAVLLALYVAAEPLLPTTLADPTRWTPGLSAGAAIVALLAADVVLPVPSSIVITASGAMFGLLPGTAVATAGTTASSLIAFGLGRSVRRPTRSWLGVPGAARLDRLLQRHGLAVIIATRPIPIVAETVAVLAGSGRFHTRAFAAGALIGSLATSAVFAAAGAGAVNGRGWLALPIAASIATGAWLTGARLARPETPPRS